MIRGGCSAWWSRCSSRRSWVRLALPRAGRPDRLPAPGAQPHARGGRVSGAVRPRRPVPGAVLELAQTACTSTSAAHCSSARTSRRSSLPGSPPPWPHRVVRGAHHRGRTHGRDLSRLGPAGPPTRSCWSGTVLAAIPRSSRRSCSSRCSRCGWGVPDLRRGGGLRRPDLPPVLPAVALSFTFIALVARVTRRPCSTSSGASTSRSR